jgi:hypothetical protein
VCNLQKSHYFHPHFTFFLPVSRAPKTNKYSFHVVKKNKQNGKDNKSNSHHKKLTQLTPSAKPLSGTSRLDGELLQVLVIGDIGSDGIADDIGGLLAIGLLPLSVELLVGLGHFLLRCY